MFDALSQKAETGFEQSKHGPGSVTIWLIMKDQPVTKARPGVRISAVLNGVCPHCEKGAVYDGIMTVARRCSECGYDYHPEEGFYLGAMVASYFLGAGIASIAVVAIRFSGMEIMPWIVVIPIAITVVLVPFILRYSRIVWLHVDHAITNRLDGESPGNERTRR